MNRNLSTFLLVTVLLYDQCRTSRGQGLINKSIDAVKKGAETVSGAIKKGVDFVSGAVKGAGEMKKTYSDMRAANWQNSDKYFHARGNFDAAKHGAGGEFAAKVISDARELFDRVVKKDSAAEIAADQAANKWGRSGGDPNIFRPEGLPSKYKK